MMMEEIHNYICANEVCIEKVRAGLMHTMAELYELVGRSVATSIQRTVGDTFFSANYYVLLRLLNITIFNSRSNIKIFMKFYPEAG